MSDTENKFVKLMQSKVPFWITTLICIILGVIGIILSDHLTNRVPFTICFAIAFILVITKEVCYHVSLRMLQKENRLKASKHLRKLEDN